MMWSQLLSAAMSYCFNGIQYSTRTHCFPNDITLIREKDLESQRISQGSKAMSKETQLIFQGALTSPSHFFKNMKMQKNTVRNLHWHSCYSFIQDKQLPSAYNFLARSKWGMIIVLKAFTTHLRADSWTQLRLLYVNCQSCPITVQSIPCILTHWWLRAMNKANTLSIPFTG